LNGSPLPYFNRPIMRMRPVNRVFPGT
jgi:hypothetical protein